MLTAVFVVIAIVAALVLVSAIVCRLARRNLPDLTPEVRSRLPGEFVELSQGVTHYQWHGPEDGRKVVLVHGGTQAGYVWDRVSESLARAGFRVLCYDHYGRGYSDRPETAYDVDLYDRQLTELLETVWSKEPVDLVGYSQGAGIAAVFMDRNSERVRKLVLIAPAGFPVNLPFSAKLVLVPFLGDRLIDVFGRKILMRDAGRALKDRKLLPKVQAQLQEQLKYKGYLPALLSMLRRYPLHNLTGVYARAARHHIPTLIVWGDADETVPFAHSENACATMPEAELQVLPGSTHSVVYEEPEKLNPVLIDFLSR